MIVKARLSHLKGIKLSEYALRFFFGGVCTMAAGLIAKRFGPAVGGLFLSFPAIFPAGASLIETHEKMHKRRAGYDGQVRGRMLAGVDAAGAAIACVGLAGFGVVVWKALPGHSAAVVIALASVTWLVLSMALWLIRKSHLFAELP